MSSEELGGSTPHLEHVALAFYTPSLNQHKFPCPFALPAVPLGSGSPEGAGRDISPSLGWFRWDDVLGGGASVG